MIDEVATTAVRYDGKYDFATSRNEYLNTTFRKEQRLSALVTFLQQHPDILAAVYFNVDYTYGLSFKVTGEADRAIVDIDTNRTYDGFYQLYGQGEQSLQNLADYFMHAKVVQLDEQEIIVSNFIEKEI